MAGGRWGWLEGVRGEGREGRGRLTVVEVVWCGVGCLCVSVGWGGGVCAVGWRGWGRVGGNGWM